VSQRAGNDNRIHERFRQTDTHPPAAIDRRRQRSLTDFKERTAVSIAYARQQQRDDDKGRAEAGQNAH
jgi:hypothetical protein